MVSQFERQVVILPDQGVRDQLSMDVLSEIISIMTRHLRRKELRQALELGLDGIHAALGSHGAAGTQNSDRSGKNELSDEIIEEEGV